jgi:hypothetical protein
MASKKQLVPSELQINQSLPTIDSGFVGFGAKSDGLYMKFSDGSEYKLLSLKDGNLIVSGTTVPDTSVGRVGDYYINNTDWTIYGPKTATWGTATSLKGSDGVNGNMWYTGTATPTNEQYSDGDFYLKSTGFVYQKIGGSWVVVSNLKGNDGIGTAETVGALVATLNEKTTLEDLDLFSLRDRIDGIWKSVSFADLFLNFKDKFDDLYETKNMVVVNYYVTNVQELTTAWNDAQTKNIPAKIYASGIMDLESDLVLSGSKQVQIEGVPYFTFQLNTYNLSIYSPLLKNVVFFNPNSTGYIKSLNGGASLDYCIFRNDSYGAAPAIPHVVLNGPFVNNTGNVILNDIYHSTDNYSTNINPNTVIQPIYIKDNSGVNGNRLGITVKNINHSLSFDRYAKVLITTNPDVIVSVTGDTSWKYDPAQLKPGAGLHVESKLSPVTSVHDLRVNDFTESGALESTDKVLIERGGKVILAPKDEVGSTIEYSTNIEADKLSTTKVSAIKTLYDWAVGKFQSVLVSGTNIKTINSTSILGSGDIVIEAGSVDYDDLTDKPQINSVELSGNKTALELGLALDNHTHNYEPANANIQTHISSNTNPHSVNKAQVGLSNVDNTSDLSKPISNATQNALDLKAMQNPGICQKCPILPADIVINPTANTLTIATVKGGQTISAGNPIRFYTDGSGIITKHEKTAPVVFNFTNTNGVWYFHFDNTGDPVATQTPWADFNVVATVYRFYLNDQLANADKITVRAWECHLNDTSAADHAWKHAQGTQYVNGFDSSTNVLAHLNGVPTVAPNTDGRNSVVALTTGKNSDDGLEYTVTNTTAIGKFNQDLGQTITASLNATNSALFKIRTNDAAGRLSFLPATRFPFAWDVATNSPQYITPAGVRTLVPDNNWFVYYSYALQDDVQGEAIKLVSAETAFTTWAAAKDHAWKALQNLYATLKDKEIRLLYKYIFYCDKTGGQAFPVGCKYSGLVLVEDQRTQLLTFTTSGGSTGSVIASNVTETTDGNVQAAIDGLRSSLAAGPANNSIANLKLAQVPTQTIKGRASSGTGDVEDLSAEQARTLIGVNTDQIPLYCSDMTSDLTVSITVSKLRFMFEDARTLQSVVGSLVTAATGSVLTVDIKKNGTSIFSTLLTFDASENTTRTATIPAVLAGAISFAIGDYIDIYITTVGSVTAGKGLLVTLKTTR